MKKQERLVGIGFIFNVILDDKKNIIAAVAGKNNEAYLEGIRKYDSIYKREVEETADIVITSQGGYPKGYESLPVSESSGKCQGNSS